MQAQHRVEGVDHEQPHLSLGDLGQHVREHVALEAVVGLVEHERPADGLVGDAERPKPGQNLAPPHRVQVGPGDGVTGVHLCLRQDQRQPRLQRLRLAAQQGALAGVEQPADGRRLRR